MIFNDFSVATSLHGYTYLQSVNSMILKVIWILVILIMTGLGVTFVAINTDEYFKSRITTTIESSTADLSVRIFFYLMLELVSFNLGTISFFKSKQES